MGGLQHKDPTEPKAIQSTGESCNPEYGRKLQSHTAKGAPPGEQRHHGAAQPCLHRLQARIGAAAEGQQGRNERDGAVKEAGPLGERAGSG